MRGCLRGEIRYEGVTFGYEAHKRVLDGIDLAIHPGETVAFVGPSGRGEDDDLLAVAALL